MTKSPKQAPLRGASKRAGVPPRDPVRKREGTPKPAGVPPHDPVRKREGTPKRAGVPPHDPVRKREGAPKRDPSGQREGAGKHVSLSKRGSGRATGLSQIVREDRVRAATLEILGHVLEEGQLADRALARVLRREDSLWSGERRAVAEAVYGLLRRESALRQAIERGLHGPLSNFATTDRLNVLLAGHLQIEGKQTSTASLPLPLREALLSLRADLDADLAAAAERGGPAEAALAHSLPEWLATQVAEEIGADETFALFAALNRRAPLTLRTNLLKGSREALLADLATGGVPCRPTPLSPWGVFIDSNVNAFAQPAFKEGRFELQDEGSQLLALLCRARPGQRVVDACAGGGGKSLALAAEMHNRGELWALDVHEKRLDQLKPRARRAGASNIRSVPIPERGPLPDKLAPLLGHADLVLVDAPCSGIGALRRNPDARRRLSPESIAEQAQQQLAILSRMAALVKTGGLLVYATCSVLRAEDEAIVEAFLAGHPDFASAPTRELLGPSLADAIEAPLVGRPPGLQSATGLRLWPQRHGTDGFFGAGLRRRSVPQR